MGESVRLAVHYLHEQTNKLAYVMRIDSPHATMEPFASVRPMCQL